MGIMKFQTHTCRFLTVILLLSLLLGSAPGVRAESRQEQLDSKIAQIVSQIPASADTDAKKALYLHDYIVQNVSYEVTGDHQTAFGALLDGKAVCAGYADAYQRLLTAVGIRAYTLIGTADNGDGEPFPHAWTMLFLDGNCVFTDVTWDDPFINGEQRNDNLSYTYFQLSYEQISRDHFPDAASKALIPATCNHTGYDYYSIMQGEGTGCGIFNDSTTPKEAAKYFRYLGKSDGKDQFYCNFRFEGSDMLGWISRNWGEIASALGLTGTRNVSYLYSESDAQMTISGTLRSAVSVVSVTVAPTTLLLDKPGMTAQLSATVSPSNATDQAVTYSSSDPSVATVNANGLVTAVGNGTAVITLKTNDGGKTATCKVTVSIPAETEPTEPVPTEPTETTKPPVTTEPPVTTVPTVPTEPEMPTEPIVTDPPVTTEPVETVPSDTTEPTTQPTVPSGTEATEGTAPSADVTVPTTQQQADSKPSKTPSEPPAENIGSKTVLIVILASGAVLTSAVLVLLLKRR